MTSFEIEGKLIRKYDIEQKTASFQSREFVIEVQDGNYPQFVKFQLVQDRCGLIDSCEDGSLIKVSFDLRGREWQGKYFTNLNAWRVEKVGAQAAAPRPAVNESASFPAAADEPAAANDDLPF